MFVPVTYDKPTKIVLSALLKLAALGFHMSGKSQTNGDFTFCRPSQILPIYRIIARSLPQILDRRHVYL